MIGFKNNKTYSILGNDVNGSSINGAIGAVGSTIGGALSNGMSTTAGSIMGAAGDAIGMINPIIGAGVKVLSGLTNAAFGSKMNDENIARFESENTSLGNAEFTPGSNLIEQRSNMSLLGDVSQSDVGKDGWFSNKAKNKAKQINRQRELANNRMLSAFNSAVASQDSMNDANVMSGFFALGGPLGYSQPIMMMPNSSYTPSSGAINYQLSSDVLGINRAKANTRSSANTPVNITTGIKELQVFADGGGIHIKPENRGKFTEYKKRTGKTTEEALHSPDPHVRQMANFARNAAKWHHENGGYIAGESYDVDEDEVRRLISSGYQVQFV